MSFFRSLALLILVACCCFGQSWELGAAGGFSFYRDATITNPAASAQAGFNSGVAASAELGENIGDHFGGELRYTFLNGASKLGFAGQEATMSAIAHAVHYDFLLYATPKNSKVRPYLAAGGGVKYYVATGAETDSQPLSNFAFLTHAKEVEGLLSAGGGLKVKVSEHWLLRVDFRYYLTPFPQSLLTPAPNAKVNGWLHDFVPLAGFDWTF
jgi:outer membrane protein with beta-barrel domain